MRNSTSTGGRSLLVATAVIAAAIVSVGASDTPPAGQGAAPLKLTAFAINMGSVGALRPGAPGAGTVHISIDRWSTEEERAALVRAFQEKGAEGLLAALQQTRSVGGIRTPNSSTWELHYAAQEPTEDGGRRIVIATNRRIGTWEAGRDARSIDYPFTLIELRIDKHGEGQGKLALATKIARGKDGTRFELENYSSEPVHLQDVRVQKG